MGEIYALPGQYVEIRRPHVRVTGVCGRLLPPLVAEDEHNIGFLSHGSLCERAARTGSEPARVRNTVPRRVRDTFSFWILIRQVST
jgi:hypothetical protein